MAAIGSLMQTRMITARPGDSVAEAARSMSANGVGAVLVVEEGRLTGVLSERDVLGVVAEGRDPARTTVAEVATREVVSVDVDTHVRQCVEVLRSKGIRHLPVLKDGKPAGILSSRDFFAYVAEGLERVVDKARYERSLAEGEDPYDHLGGSYGE